MSPITTHVLDTAAGRPAGGIPIILEFRQADGTWNRIGGGVTDPDGRVKTLLPADFNLKEGFYRLTFKVDEYFKASGIEAFYAEIPVQFELRTPEPHYHVPLLLNPFGYSTYRGS